MAYKVVCISSEDGAGAAEAAILVSSDLGFPLIDEEIVTRAALEAGVDEGVIADVERRKSTFSKLLEGLGPAAATASGIAMLPEDPGLGQPASNELRMLIRSAIEETAAAGNVVITSHAASLTLAGRDDVLRVLITASKPTRQRRLADSMQIGEKEAARVIKRSDAGRADYLKRFYGVAEQPTHYDLVINTDRLTPDDAARLIIDAANGSSGEQSA